MKLEELSLLSSSDPQHGGMLDAGSPRGTLVWTPLQLACALGDEELVSSLLAGAKHSVLDTGKVRSRIEAYSLFRLSSQLTRMSFIRPSTGTRHFMLQSTLVTWPS